MQKYQYFEGRLIFVIWIHFPQFFLLILDIRNQAGGLATYVHNTEVSVEWMRLCA